MSSTKSPMSTLPTEMLSLTFKYVCLFHDLRIDREIRDGVAENENLPSASSLQEGSDEVTRGSDYEYPLLVLGAVSSYWRETAFSNPQLWSSIAFDVYPQETPRIAQLLGLFFKNSAELPLSFTLYFYASIKIKEQKSLVHPTIDNLIFENLPRIHRIHLMNMPFWWNIIPCDYVDPERCFSGFRLTPQHHYPHITGEHLYMSNISSPDRLILCYRGNRAVNSLPSTLSTLEINGKINPHDVYSVFKFSSITHLILDDVDLLYHILGLYCHDESPRAPINLPGLHKLTIRAPSGLDSDYTLDIAGALVTKFHTPCSARLCLEIVAPKVDWAEEAIKDLRELLKQGMKLEVLENSECVSWLR